MNNNNATSLLNDCYHVGGKYFPVPDENTDKGQELGPESLVDLSDTQLDPGLHASGGVNAPSIRGAEGKAFPPDKNSKDSDDESQTFAGDRDSSVSINLTTGQIESTKESRFVPVPQDANDGEMRPLVKFKKARGDVKENRV